MSSKHKKTLSLSKRESTPDYLKIVKKESVDLSDIVDECKCKASDKKFLTSSLKHRKTLHKSKNVPIIYTKPHNIVNFSPAKDNYGWFKITVMYGQKYGKKFIILNLLKCIYPYVFTPVMYREEGNRSVFFVDEEAIAIKLGNCNKQITTKDGYRLAVFFEKGFPECGSDNYAKKSEITDNTLSSKLRYVTSKRICEETKTLDLTRFHCDPDLADDYFCALFISNIFSAVVDFVVEYMPDLEVLKLQKNNLRLSSNLAKGILKFPQLKTLYLNDNLIRNLNGLTLLGRLKLEKFYLYGNPLRGQEFEYKENYVKYIETLFPTLSVLDGVKIKKPIVAKLEADDEAKKEKLPSPIKNFSFNFEAQEIAQQFIKKYFTAFDSESRESLLSLYHKLAFFSMTLSSITPRYYKPRNLDDYNAFHRNLITIKSTDQRRSLLKQGRLPIITLLLLLPDTRHYLNSFSTDVTIQTNKRMMISISGCFKEINTEQQAIFCFNRTFIISMEADKHTIHNDQLYLSFPTSKQKLLSANEFSTVTPTPPTVLEMVPPTFVSTSDISESKSKVQSESMEKCISDINSTSDIQVLDEPMKEHTPDVIFIPNSQVKTEPMEEQAPDVIFIPNPQVKAEPMEDQAPDVIFIPNSQVRTEPMEEQAPDVILLSKYSQVTDNNSTSKSKVPTESIVRSEPLTPFAELTLESGVTADRLKEKLSNLRGILINCLSTIEEFLSDKEFRGRFN